MADIDWSRWLRPGDRVVTSHMSAEPAVLLRNEQSGKSHIDQPLPDRRIAIFVLVQAAQDPRAMRACQIIAHGFGQDQLVFGKAELHQPAPTLGSPSRRSAVILRCTSFEPA